MGGPLDKVLIEKTIYHLCVFQGEHSSKKLMQGLQTGL